MKAEKRIVDRLRSQILTLEMEKSRCNASSSTSGTTASTCDDDDSGSEVGEDTAISAAEGEKNDRLDVERESNNTLQKSKVIDMTDIDNEEDEIGDGEVDEGNDADDIRAKAERMLLWADYSTSKRTISMRQDSPSSSDEDESRHSSTLGDDDAANGEPANTARGGSRGSRLGQLLTNLQDVLVDDPEFDELGEDNWAA